MIFRLLLALIFLGASCHESKAAETSTYYIPPSQFNAVIEVMDNGFANIFGLFRSATGNFAFDETTKSLSNLKIALDTTSLIASNNDSQRDLANLLSSFQNPELRITAGDTVVFTDNKADIKANLTFHGITIPLTLEATLNKSGKSPKAGNVFSSEGDAIGLSMRGSFKRADFGMAEAADTPARFGDTFTLLIEVEALKQ